MALGPAPHSTDADGQTPLDPNETGGLIPRHLVTQGDLNDWEQQNILQAVKWLRRTKFPEVLSERFCRELHRRMFDNTWDWAGTYRLSNKNIGCDWPLVPVKLNQVLGNAQYWLNHQSYAADEAAARFHHALVVIHPFPNGNGRHARLMVDTMLMRLGREPFSWGSTANLQGRGAVRNRYIAALRAADASNFEPLLAFVRS